MLPTVHVGPLTLQTAGLILLLSVWIALARAEKTAPRFQIQPDQFYNLALVILIAGLIGARLGFAMRNLDAFLASPGGLLSLSPQMLSLWDGVLIGALAGIVYAQRAHISLRSALDALTPALAIVMAGVHLANLASGAAFGTPTHQPWGILLWGQLRHPVQLYETLAALLIAVLVWPRAAGREPLPSGLRFAAFAGLTAFTRLLLEFFRGDGVLWIVNIRTAQAVAWVVLALSLLAASRLLKQTRLERKKDGSNLR
jgi:prolipoprotein diacylglyceryltransferase